jgi:hypothetical protein
MISDKPARNLTAVILTLPIGLIASIRNAILMIAPSLFLRWTTGFVLEAVPMIHNVKTLCLMDPTVTTSFA